MIGFDFVKKNRYYPVTEEDIKRIEKKYGIVFNETDISKISNIEKASKYIYNMIHSADTGVPGGSGK